MWVAVKASIDSPLAGTYLIFDVGDLNTVGSTNVQVIAG
jgi:hypothetical protein